MPVVNMSRLKELSQKALPGVLNQAKKNSVELFAETDEQVELRAQFLQAYRDWFYETPRGDEVFDLINLEEAAYVEPDTIAKAESYHLLLCVRCKVPGKLTINTDGWNYFFECEKCVAVKHK